MLTTSRGVFPHMGLGRALVNKESGHTAGRRRDDRSAQDTSRSLNIVGEIKEGLVKEGVRARRRL